MHQHRPISLVATGVSVDVVVVIVAKEKVCSQLMFCATVRVVSQLVHSGREWGKLEIYSVMATSTYSLFKLDHDQYLPTILSKWAEWSGWVRAIGWGFRKAWWMR